MDGTTLLLRMYSIFTGMHQFVKEVVLAVGWIISIEKNQNKQATKPKTKQQQQQQKNKQDISREGNNTENGMKIVKF